MTPRQLHALEWAVRCAGLMLTDGGREPESDAEYMAARAALAAGWRDYRASRVNARTCAPRRALQRVPSVAEYLEKAGAKMDAEMVALAKGKTKA